MISQFLFAIRVHPWFPLLSLLLCDLCGSFPMCGIGGILRTDGQPIPEEWLDAIDARIAYRGPDGHGRFRDRVEIDDPKVPGGKRVIEVAFVHRRLSIIDHADGHQPMVSERGRNENEGLVAVVFNGCIYNHRELRKELEGNGHKFVTDHSDTEVLIHGWREWGEDLAAHLEGMYAFAIWDRTRGWLALSRDVFGEKPLYYSAHASTSTLRFRAKLAFSSDFWSLHALAIQLHDDSGAAPEWTPKYLRFGYLAAESLIQSDVKVVSPGESKAASIDNELIPLDPDPFDYGYEPNLDGSDPFEPEDVERRLDLAVLRRLDSDVPLGCFLSGGVDSSLITLFVKRHRPDVQTFSVRMPDERYDESKHAERVAAHLDVDHTTLDVAMNPAEDLVRLIDVLGQPFGDSSILPTYWVSKAAREHVKVALSGDGGDEMFLGYERYQAVRTLAKHRGWFSLIPQVLQRSHPKSWLHKLGRLGDMARDYPTVGAEAMESIFGVADIEQLGHHVKPTHWRRDQVEAIVRGRRVFAELFKFDFRRSDSRRGLIQGLQRGYRAGLVEGTLDLNDPLKELQDFDVWQYLPDDLLRKVDTASMACGLEVRCPFLDRDLARAALSAPIRQLMPGGQRKGLLRQIARKYLPKEIVDRPKMGFAIPIGEWFRSDDLPARGAGMKTLLLDHLNSAEPFGPIQLNKKAVQRFIDEHMTGKRDHGQRLFTLLTLSIWARQQARRSTPPT